MFTEILTSFKCLIRSISWWCFVYLYWQIIPWIICDLFTTWNRVMSVFKPKWIKETQKPRNQFRKFIFKILFIYIYEQTWQIPYIYIYTIYREYVSVCLQSGDSVSKLEIQESWWPIFSISVGRLKIQKTPDISFLVRRQEKVMSQHYHQSGGVSSRESWPSMDWMTPT